MEQFLIEIGLGGSVATFQEHNVRLEQIGNLLTDEIKELLPRIGDRETFRKAIERKRIEDESSSKRQERCPKRKRVEEAEAFETREMPVRGKEKLDLIVEIFKQDEAVKLDLIKKARAVVTPYLFEENRRDGSGWEVIDFDSGKLNCPLCSTQIVPQYRRNSYFDWMVENYDRHVTNKHKAVKYLEYQGEASSGNDDLIPSEQDSVNDDVIGGEMDAIDNDLNPNGIVDDDAISNDLGTEKVVDNGEANVVQNDDGNDGQNDDTDDAQNVKPNSSEAPVGDAVVTQKVNHNGETVVVQNGSRNDDGHNDDATVDRSFDANLIKNLTDDQRDDVSVGQNIVQNGDVNVSKNFVHNGDVNVVQNVGGNVVQNHGANVAQNGNVNVAQGVQNDGENIVQNGDVNVAQNVVHNGDAAVVENGDFNVVQNVGGNDLNIAQDDWQQPGATFG